MSSLTYSSYLRLDELLSLQRPLSEGPEHDEMLFIVIHQVYELWFKQLLHELDLLRLAFANGHTPIIGRTLKRVLTILKTAVGQVDILETMTPVSFGSFRDRLEAASGFQSRQFRELEMVLGDRREEVLQHYPAGGPDRARLQRRLTEPSVWDCFLRYLARCGYHIPGELLGRQPAAPNPSSPEVQDTLVQIYRGDPGAWQICELLVDLDEGVQEWRYRHLKMVERTIGTKHGTGGSAGADYLRSTISRPLFPDLWAIRTQL